jgi:uncharacterized protein
MPENSTQKKRKVAVIGGGTGLTTAWGLDNQDAFDVTLFESSDRLGGHIHSIKLNDVMVEGGAEFIGSPEVYANVHILFKYLGIKLDEFQLNMDFNNLKTKDHTVLPPLYETSSGKDSAWSFLKFCGLFGKTNAQDEMRLSWDTLLTELCTMINLNEAIKDAKKKLTSTDDMVTLEHFVNEFVANGPPVLNHRRTFADEFLYPLIAAGWGVSVDTIKTFGAHYAMQYLEADLTWYDAPRGLSQYIRHMKRACTNTSFQMNTTIDKVIPVTVDGETKYQLQKKNGTFFHDEEGKIAVYDDVVLSTSGEVTANLISGIDDQELRDLREKLSRVTYYDTTVVFHQDPKYRSKNNTVVHSRFDGTQSANTMCKSWKYPEGTVPIMKTWVLPGQPMPENVLYEAHYRHPVMDRNYYEAQKALHEMQGKTGIWYGGIIAGVNDSHESGVTVALEVAARLNQQENTLENNERLKLFPKVMATVKSTAERDSVLSSSSSMSSSM